MPQEISINPINLSAESIKSMPNLLKLVAFDTSDLAVLSSFVQDAVVKSADIENVSASGTVILPVNRFAWEIKPEHRLLRSTYQRRLSVIQFAHVNEIYSKGIDRQNSEQVLSVLAIGFIAFNTADDPSGHVEISFSGGAVLRVGVECLETRLTDLGPAWATNSKPRHGT